MKTSHLPPPLGLAAAAPFCLVGSGAFAAGAALSVNAADYPSLNEAVGALPPEGGTVVLPPGCFLLKEALNLSWARHKSPQFSVNLRGAGKLATVHSDGLAGVYLDGTKGNFNAISLRDVRVEGEQGKYCLYARGHVFSIAIDGGNWSSTYETILQEGAASFTDQAAAVSDTGQATQWRIQNLGMCNWDGAALHPDYKPMMAELGYDAGNTCWPDDQPYVFMRFARLVDSVIEPAMFCSLRFREDAAGKPVIQDSFSCGAISKAIRDRWRLVALGAECRGNRITASEPGRPRPGGSEAECSDGAQPVMLTRSSTPERGDPND